MNPSHPLHFVFAGGGSGGHLSPGFAVAEQLLARDTSCRITFLTSARPVDRRIWEHGPLAGDPRCCVIPLPMTRPPEKNLSAWTATWRLMRSWNLCRQLFRRQPVSVVFSTGGFAAVPPLLTARRQSLPVVLFESNIVPGRVVRWAAPFAAARFCVWSSPGSESFEAVGAPVCTAFGTSVSTAVQPPDQCPHLLVVGGSQGSRRLDQLIQQALQRSPLPDSWTLLHQTSVFSADSSPEYHNGRIVTFIPDMPGELKRAGLVVSRAGAATLAEIAATGRPSLLVPLRSAADDHQRHNSEHFAAAGAARWIDETHPDAAQHLARQLAELSADPELRSRMGRAAASLAPANAAETIADRLFSLAEAHCQTR